MQQHRLMAKTRRFILLYERHWGKSGHRQFPVSPCRGELDSRHAKEWRALHLHGRKGRDSRSDAHRPHHHSDDSMSVQQLGWGIGFSAEGATVPSSRADILRGWMQAPPTPAESRPKPKARPTLSRLEIEVVESIEAGVCTSTAMARALHRDYNTVRMTLLAMEVRGIVVMRKVGRFNVWSVA